MLETDVIARPTSVKMALTSAESSPLEVEMSESLPNALPDARDCILHSGDGGRENERAEKDLTPDAEAPGGHPVFSLGSLDPLGGRPAKGQPRGPRE